MPSWMQSVRPSEAWMASCLPLRVREEIFALASRSRGADLCGVPEVLKESQMSARRSVARAMVRPMSGARERRVRSTSGSSGMGEGQNCR